MMLSLEAESLQKANKKTIQIFEIIYGLCICMERSQHFVPLEN